MKTKLISVAVLGLGLAAGVAHAAPMPVYGLSVAPGGVVSGPAKTAAEVTFGGALVAGSLKTDGVTGPAGAASSAALSAIGGQIQSAPLPDNVDPAAYGPGIFGNGSGRFDTSGNGQFWETATSFTVSFAQGIEAFGVYVTDAGDFDGQFSIDLIDAATGAVTNYNLISLGNNAANSPTRTNPLDDANDGWLEFFGFYDDINRYSAVRFNIVQGDLSNPNSWDFLGFDSFMVGTVPDPTNDVPEPGSLALVGLSLLGLAAARRRQPRA